MHDYYVAAHQSGYGIYSYQRYDRSGIFDHTFCLQETWHGNAKREDTLQVNTAQEGENHGGVHNAGFARGNQVANGSNGSQ